MAIISNRHILLQTLLLCTAMFSAMGGPALAPALPAIQAAYHDIPNIEFWTKALVAISGLFAALGAPLFGWLSDNWGRRRSLILALAAWGLSGASGMLDQPFWTLLAGRAFLGLSLGGLLASNSAMIADCFINREQRSMMGLQSTFSSMGIIFALIVSGLLAELHWQWPFALFLSAFLVLPLTIAAPKGGNNPTADLAAKPGLPFSAPFLLVCLFGFMGMTAFNIIPTQLPFYLKQQGMHAASNIGMLLAVLPVTAAIAGRLYGRISMRFTLWNMFLFSGALMLTGFSLIAISRGMAGTIAGLAFVGMGFGTAMPHVNVVMATIIGAEARGQAMGFLTSSKFLGLFASPFLMQPVLAWFGYAPMFLFAGALLMLSALLISVLGFLKTVNPCGNET